MNFDRQLAAVTASGTRHRRGKDPRNGTIRNADLLNHVRHTVELRVPATKRTREPGKSGKSDKSRKLSTALDFDAQMKRACHASVLIRRRHARDVAATRSAAITKHRTRFDDQMPKYPVIPAVPAAPVLSPAAVTADAPSTSIATAPVHRKDGLSLRETGTCITTASPSQPDEACSGTAVLPLRHGTSPGSNPSSVDSPPGVPDWTADALFGNVRATRVVDGAFAEQSSVLLLGPPGTGKSLSVDLAARHYGFGKIVRVLEQESAGTMRGVEGLLRKSLQRPLFRPVVVICDPVEALADEGFAFATQTQEGLPVMPTAETLVGRFRDAIAEFSPLNNIVLVLIANTLPPAWSPLRKSVRHIAYFERLPRQACDYVCKRALDAHGWSVFSRDDVFERAGTQPTRVPVQHGDVRHACRCALEDYCGMSGTRPAPRSATAPCVDVPVSVAASSNTSALIALHSRIRRRTGVRADTTRHEAAAAERSVTEAEFRAAIVTVCGGDARLVQNTTRFLLLANDANAFRVSARRLVQERNALSCPTDSGLLYTMIRGMLLLSGANATVPETMSVLARGDVPRRKLLTIVHAFMAEWIAANETCSVAGTMQTIAGCMDDLCRIDRLARCHGVPNDVLYAHAGSMTRRLAGVPVVASRVLTERLMDAQVPTEPAVSLRTEWSIAYRPSAAVRFGLLPTPITLADVASNITQTARAVLSTGTK